MRKVRAYVLVEGRVQGVFFRATARDVASNLGLGGWVRNRWDGKVEIVAEGREEEVKKMVDWCYQGPPGAVVTRAKVKWQSYQEEFNRFSIRY
ncbi:acylphosphatase [Patescibacteria group bacterium]|nr:acylphosphatase [Patescibacteria group bacterium]